MATDPLNTEEFRTNPLFLKICFIHDFCSTGNCHRSLVQSRWEHAEDVFDVRGGSKNTRWFQKIRGVSKIFFRKPGFLKQNMITEHCWDLIGKKKIILNYTRWFQKSLMNTHFRRQLMVREPFQDHVETKYLDPQKYHMVP